MGVWQSVKHALGIDLPEPPGPRFAIDEGSIDPAVFGLVSYADPTSPAPRVDRRSAMQCGAVKRSRDLVCGGIGNLTLQMYAPDKSLARRDLQQLLDQPEPDVAPSVTYTRLVEDLMFEQVAWWEVLKLGTHGFPVSVRRHNPRRVDRRDDGSVWIDVDPARPALGQREARDGELIRFDSPNDALLVAAARAIRMLLALAAAGFRYADDTVPLGWFEAVDGIDPFEDEDDPDAAVDQFLARWSKARAERLWGYVPPGVALKSPTMNPRQLQLVEWYEGAVVELARHAGVDPEDLGVSTTSRTYFNAETKRKDKLDFTLLGYIRAIEGRLTMPDVTPRNYYVRVKVSDFLRSDLLTRLQAYEIGQRLQLWDRDEIRAEEDKPPLEGQAAMPRPQLPAQPQDQRDNVTALPTRSASGFGFSSLAGEITGVEYTLDAPQSSEAFAVDVERRTISGLVVPYGVQARSKGRTFQFSAGSLDLPADHSRVKLWIQHDPTQAVGYAARLEERSEPVPGLYGTFKVARGAAGDHALSMAEDKVWDGLSVGIGYAATFAQRDGVFHAVRAPFPEVSLTPAPSFDDARVHTVAAQADTEGLLQMSTTTQPGLAAATAAGSTPTQAQGAAAASAVDDQVRAALEKFGIKVGADGAAPVFSSDAVTKAIADGFAALQRPQENGTPAQTVPLAPREIVPANGAGAAQLQVNEEAPYRFDGSTRGEYCFTDDLRDSQNGNQAAKKRLETFIDEVHEAQFAVTTTNAGAFNPTQNKPEMYVPQLRFTRPLWDSVSTGVITDKTPFTVPKFSSASGLAGDHTEGTEPTPGAFAATVQTVTPTAISGKVEINREVWDQGGNPQTDTIVWGEMQNAYFEAIEAKIATMLNGLVVGTLYSGAEINLAGAVDGPLQTAMTNLLVDLQFVRGGNRYTAAAADAMLYKALVGAKDSTGRPLFPLLNPTNAQGQLAPLAAGVNVIGQTYRPAWALNVGVANAYNSYQFVPTSVWQWASAPKRFTFEYQVKSIDMAVWGYTGGAVLRNSDVIRIDYTTADV